MKRNSRDTIRMIALVATAASMNAACTKPVDGFFTAGVGLTPSTMDGSGDLSINVCDPFGDTGNPNNLGVTSRNGLLGTLRVAPTKCDPSDIFSCEYALNLDSYNHLPEEKTNLYFSNLNVTPRTWTSGFPGESNLNEYFQIQFNSSLQLPAGMPSGEYEFAIIADDGVRVTINGESVINQPEMSSALMRCSDTPMKSFALAPGMSLPLEIQYYQGPADFLGIVLLWRRVADRPALSTWNTSLWGDRNKFENPTDPLCASGDNMTLASNIISNTYTPLTTPDWRIQSGKYLLPPLYPKSHTLSETSLDFDFNAYLYRAGTEAPSSLLQAAMRDRKWEVVPETAFLLPDGRKNPCTP